MHGSGYTAERDRYHLGIWRRQRHGTRTEDGFAAWDSFVAPPSSPIDTWPPNDPPLMVPLVPAFRYVHEPLAASDSLLAATADEPLLASLRERLRHSDGGAFLVAGYRGAGKTTLVRRVVETVVAGSPECVLVVDVNVARPLTMPELLYAVVRRLFEALEDRHLLRRIEPSLRQAMLLSYLRTSISLTRTLSEATETATSLGLTGSGTVSRLLGGLSPSFQRNRKVTRSMAEQASYLAYNVSDVEHDFMRLVTLLRKSELRGRFPWTRRRQRVRLIVVLDELDKLSATPEGVAALDDLLVSLKTILSTSGVHFILVAGTDLLDKVRSDAMSGVGIFESVFAWIGYVPCSWRAPGLVLRRLAMPGSDQEIIGLLDRYLDFKARGLPRRLLQELNSMVVWTDGGPVLRVPRHDLERVTFYADLAEMLQQWLGDHPETSDGSLDDDRFRLGAYYVTDWVLRSEGGVFEAAEVLGGARSLSALLSVSQIGVESLLRHLHTQGMLERRGVEDLQHTMIGDVAAAQVPSYRLTGHVRQQLLRLTRANPRERIELLEIVPPEWTSEVDGARWPSPPYATPPRANLGVDRHPTYVGRFPDGWGSPTPEPGLGATPQPSEGAYGGSESTYLRSSEPTYAVPRSGRILDNGRYELLDVLGMGATGAVYAATETATGLRCAIKMLNPSVLSDPTSRARFRREAQIAMKLDHHGVVATKAFLEEDDGRLALVMELVEGEALTRMLDGGPIPPPRAVAIVAGVLDAVAYVHDQGIMRLDLKPANILIRPDGSPVLLDFGIARGREVDDAMAEQDSSITQQSALIGTPAYMAPEQLTGGRPDRRSDIFSAGVVLFEMLGGSLTKRPDESPFDILARRLVESIDVSGLPISDELAGVVAHATDRDLSLRFATADDFRFALLDTPEAAA